MGFSIDYGIGSLGIILVALLAIPVAIVVIWWIQLNRQVREEVHDEIEDEGGDAPIA